METRKRKIAEDRSDEIPPPTQTEIRHVILFGFRRNLQPIQIFSECQIAYGTIAPSLKTISKWFRRFQTGHFSVEDEPREGRPKSSTDDVTVALVKSKIDEDPRLTQEMIANELGLNAMAVSRILSNHLGYTKKSARWVPRILNEAQKEARVHFAQFFLNKFENGQSSNFSKVVTGDESWFYKYDPETKQQSMVWSPTGANPPVKSKQQKSAAKVMMSVYFTRSKIVAAIPLEKGQTVTAKWYTEECLPKVFKNLLENRKKEDLRRYFLHHDNAPSHTAEITSNFIAISGIEEIRPAPYSPDIAPCDFWLFPKIKKKLKGKVFNSNEEIINAVNAELDKLKKQDFEDCFQKWIYRLKKCIEINGDYVEKIKKDKDYEYVNIKRIFFWSTYRTFLNFLVYIVF